MTRDRFNKKIETEERIIENMGQIIQEILSEIISVLQKKDLSVEKVNEILDKESQLDKLSLQVEQLCIETIALHQPMGVDLREIISIIKISSDLERIGDHTRKIIRKLRKVIMMHDFDNFNVLAEMTIILRQMVDQIIIAFLEKNLELTNNTLLLDHQIDEIQRSLFNNMIAKIKKSTDEETVSSEIYLLFITRFLERIGDHVQNIGERIIYLTTGQYI